ncbi:hypothetical protein [Candidatus Enterovibrio escicola]|uniref:hypothetical protein n=1 Tax=Candidatus Enterovibrio escicola TaxID=1927127 RepID=UPI0018F27495|nr:hypothetical protein [Candidatus Enterovibrio escacola]
MSGGDKIKTTNLVGIEKWSDIPDEKTEFGYFKIDTVLGTGHKSFLLTLVDKSNKLCCIRNIPNKKTDTGVETFIDIVNPTFHNFRTITSDNVTVFEDHE